MTPLVAVFGATGQTGRRVVERLAAGGHDVLAVRRSVESRSAARSGSSRVQAAEIDLAHATVTELERILTGVDAIVFAASGDPERVDRDGAIRVIEAAERVGVDRFVLLTGMGVGRARPAALYGGFWDSYFGAKEASEQRLRASTLGWTIIQPGELLNTPGTGRVTLAPTGALPIGAVSRDDVAAVITGALDDPASAGNTWELVRGDEPIAAAIARASAG